MKNIVFSEMFRKKLVDADLIDNRYKIKGMVVYKQDGLFIENVIFDLIEKEWIRMGIIRMRFPMLIPKSYLEIEKEHIAGFDSQIYWVTKAGEKELPEPLALRPTSETAIYPMFALWLTSYNDLPFKIFQTCEVFRYETKQTLPMIRVREIPFNEVHSVHRTKKDAVEFLDEAWISYMKVLGNLGIYGLKLRRPEWDKFPGAEYTDVYDVIMPNGKVLQSIGAHYLGTNFSKAYNIQVIEENMAPINPFMTCFGVSSRLTASIISAHSDDKGLINMSVTARIQCIIIPIEFTDKIINYCVVVKNELVNNGIRVELDLRQKYRPGFKYNYWEIKGIPFRISIGKKELATNRLEIISRIDRKKIMINGIEKLYKVNKYLDQYDNELCDRSMIKFTNMIQTCYTLEELLEYVRSNVCKIPVHYDQEIQIFIENLDNGSQARGIDINDTKPYDLRCIFTNKVATEWLYIARSF